MRWLMACLLCLGSSSLLADEAFYGELHLGAGGVRHSDLDFYPTIGSLSAGVYVLPNIGIEVFADTSLSDDEDEGFVLDLEEAYGIAARFQSPPGNGLSGYLVIGYVDFSVAQEPVEESLAAAAIDENFTGARFSAGVMQRLARVPQLLVSFEYRNYYADSEVKVDALLLGLRFNLR
ncbi:MAG: hypothetical protein V3U76_06330 [Granulosicoccus sp.]